MKITKYENQNKIMKQKRVVVYIPENDYQKLRAKLILLGETVSGWFRKKVQELFSEDDNG